MANYCSFEIRIKGKRGNALLLCHSIPTMDGGSITYAKGTDDAYEMRFRGSCKWSVNFNVTDDWDGIEIDTDLNTLPETMLIDLGPNLRGYSLRAKSRVLECEVQVHYWSEETEFDYFDHYVNGRRIKKRRIAYDSDNYFDWISLEFIGHEGEIDEDETSEARSLLYANRFVRHFDPEEVLSVLRDQDDDVIETSDDEEEWNNDEEDATQKLDELLEKLKQLSEEMGIEDDSEDDDDDELFDDDDESFNDDADDDSETELLDVKEYWLTPTVQFVVPDSCAIEKTTTATGESTISIKGGRHERNGEEDFFLSGIVSVNDVPCEERSLQGQQWIDRRMQEDDDEEKQYVPLPGVVPALLWSKKLPSLDIMEVKIRPFVVALQLRASCDQRLDVTIATIQNKHYDRRYFYLALLAMLQGFRVDGKTLNCTNLTVEILYSKLEPIYEEDLYSELHSDETKRISTSDWSVCLPVGFCETKSPTLLAQLSDAKLLVPEAFAYTDSEGDIPVKIVIPSSAAELDVEDVSGYIDIPSKQGIVRIVAVDYARELAETNGHPYQIATVGNENAGVFILFASSQNTTIAKCGLMTLESICEVTVIADIDASMADSYVCSIGHWLSTFEFTQSKWKTEEILLEKPECLEATLQGCFDKFDEAVEQLVTQYLRTASGNLKYLKYMQTLHGMDINIMKRNADNLLRSAFETKALGVDAASAFVEKLKLRNASEDVLKHVYTKLVEFEPACEGFQIELADDESNDTIELENGTKITQVFHRVMHDTQIVRVNEPLSIKAAIAKWKQEAGGSNPPDPKPGFMSSLEFIRAKQEIEERSAQLTARIEAHIEANPVVIIPGKKFVFTGLGIAKEEQKNHPVVKELEAKGGLFRSSVSGVTDYLVVGDDCTGETKFNAAIAQQEKGKLIHIIRLADLEKAMDMQQDEACPTADEITTASAVEADTVSETYIDRPAQIVGSDRTADVNPMNKADDEDMTPFERCTARLTEPHLDKLDGVVFSFLYWDDNKEALNGFLRSRHAIPETKSLMYADYVVVHHSEFENNEHSMNQVLELQKQGNRLQLISDEHLYRQLSMIDKDWATPIHPEDYAVQMIYSAEEVYYYVISQFCEKYQVFWSLENNQYWDAAPLRDKTDEERKVAWSRVWIATQLPEVQTRLNEVLQKMPFEDKYELVQFLYHVYKCDRWKSIAQRWEHILAFSNSWFKTEEKGIVRVRINALKQAVCESAKASLASIGMVDCTLKTIETKVFVLCHELQKDPPFGQLLRSNNDSSFTVFIESSDGTTCIPLTLEHVEYYQADCEDLLKNALARGIVDARMYAPAGLGISVNVYSAALYNVENTDQIVGAATTQYPIHYHPDTYGVRTPVREEDESLLYTIMRLSGASHLMLEQSLSDLYSVFPGYDDEHLRQLLQVYKVSKDYPEKVQRYNEIAQEFSQECWMNRILPFFSKPYGTDGDILNNYFRMYRRANSLCVATNKETLQDLIRNTLQQYRVEEQQKLAQQYPQWGDWEQAKHLLTIEDRDKGEKRRGAVSGCIRDTYFFGTSEINDDFNLFVCLHAPDGSRKIDVTSMMALGWGVSTKIVFACAIHNGIYDARGGNVVIHKEQKRILANAYKCCSLLYCTKDQWDRSGECDDSDQRQWFRTMLLNDREREEIAKQEAEALAAKLPQPLIRGKADSVPSDEVFEMTCEEVTALFANYFTQEPDIAVAGKRFQFSGSVTATDDSPVVQRVKALGGIVHLQSITREKIDYVIVCADTYSSLIRNTAIRIDRGELVQLIHVQDLDKALSLAEEKQKRIEEERKQAEEEQLRRRKEREEAERKAEEQRKQARRDQLTAEKNALQQEMDVLKGLFSAFKRKKLQARIDEVDQQLRRL